MSNTHQCKPMRPEFIYEFARNGSGWNLEELSRSEVRPLASGLKACQWCGEQLAAPKLTCQHFKEIQDAGRLQLYSPQGEFLRGVRVHTDGTVCL